MANKKRTEEASKEQLRQKIQDETQAFLASGGKIEVIPTGQSGVDLTKPGQKQIKLGNSK